MVVAGHNGAYGNAETVAKVKQSLMSLTTVPRTLTPGDEVTIPVTIFAGEASIKNVDVSLQSNDLVALTTSKEQLSFSKEGEETSFFKLKVGDKLGIAKIEVHAVSGGHKSFESIEVDVRLPNPSITKTIIAELQPGQSINKAIPSFGLAGTNQLNIEVSSLPNIAFDKRLKDLIRYPYGCLEQTTSSVLPQVFMPSLFDLSEEKTNKIHVNVQAGIDKLKTFQLLNGGFAYWPGEEEVSFWGTNYAGHFLIAANQNGYQVPSQMLKDWIGFQKKEANQWVNSTDNTEIIQAYRLFLLAYAKSPLLSAMNKLRTSIKNDQGKWLLAAAYAEIGETKVAQEIMSSSAKNISKYKETHHSYGSEFRDQAMLMYVYSKLGDRLKAKPVLSDVAKKLNGDGWLSTQETSWGLMAVSAYVGNTSEQRSTMQYSYQVNSQSKVDKSIDKTLAIHSFTDKNIVIAQNNATVTNLNKYPIFVSISMEGVPSRMNVSASSSNLSMTQTYTYESGNKVDFKNTEQGKDIICKVSVTNNSSYSYLRNIALQQLLPSGFEIHNDRLDNVTDNKNLYDYQDIRDDRVNTFFSLNKNETKIFSIRLNATYAGKFYLPATKVEAMYDNTVYATTASNEIEIVKK